MKLESAVVKIRRMRIATSVIVALLLIVMGYLATDEGLSESSRDILFWTAAILIILSVVIPISYTVYLSKQGPDLPDNEGKEDDME